MSSVFTAGRRPPGLRKPMMPTIASTIAATRTLPKMAMASRLMGRSGDSGSPESSAEMMRRVTKRCACTCSRLVRMRAILRRRRRILSMSETAGRFGTAQLLAVELAALAGGGAAVAAQPVALGLGGAAAVLLGGALGRSRGRWIY